MFLKPRRDLPEQVITRVSTENAMIAIGIIQLFKILVGLHQCLGILKGILRMYVVIGQSVAYQQRAGVDGQ